MVKRGTVKGLTDLWFVDKLTQFVKVQDDSDYVVNTRPLSESTSKTVQENKDSNMEFGSFRDSEDQEQSANKDFSNEVKLILSATTTVRPKSSRNM